MQPDATMPTSRTYDATFRAIESSPLLRQLSALAMGDQYPAEVEPFSSCSWWTLGQLAAGLRLQPGSILVDLGCGRGGPGLWLARALATHLISIDFSAAALDLTRTRMPSFLAVDRGAFLRATFAMTGLADGAADGVVSVDALPFAPDRDAVFREIRRILAPGGRVVFTCNQSTDIPDDAQDSWTQRVVRAGLHLEQRIDNPHGREHSRSLYQLWTTHADELRRELGAAVADMLLSEAAGVDQVGKRRPLVFVASRPAE